MYADSIAQINEPLNNLIIYIYIYIYIYDFILRLLMAGIGILANLNKDFLEIFLNYY